MADAVFEWKEAELAPQTPESKLSRLSSSCCGRLRRVAPSTLNSCFDLSYIIVNKQCLAASRAAAERGAELVDVTFSNVGKPILTCLDAIASKSFYPSVPDLVIGNAKKAIDAAPNKLQGSLEIGGQFHFHMETQVRIRIWSAFAIFEDEILYQ